MPYNPLLGRAPTPEEEARSAQVQRALFSNNPLASSDPAAIAQSLAEQSRSMEPIKYATNPQHVAAVQAARAAAPPARSGAMPADFEAKQRQIYKEVTGQEYKRGGAVKKAAKAPAKPARSAKPAAKANNFRRGDGLAQRGKTKGRIV